MKYIFVSDNEQWSWNYNKTPTYFNWWNTCYEEPNSCVAFIAKVGTSYKSQWVPLDCKKKLPFICKMKKGNFIPKYLIIDFGVHTDYNYSHGSI